MAKGRGPSAEALRAQFEHDWQHRGESGMFGGFFIGDVPEWNPQDGENEVAIVAFRVKENSRFRKADPVLNVPVSDAQLRDDSGWCYKLSIYTHGDVGPNKDRVICLKTLKARCPVCELYEEMRQRLAKLKSENKTDKDLEERVMRLRPSKRALYNIVSFNSKKDREQGVMVWSAPHVSIQDVLIDRSKDKRGSGWKDFTVLQENWDIFFRKTGKGLGTEYTEVDILDRRKEDVLTDDEAAELQEKAFVLDDIVEVKTYDELHKALHGADVAGSKDEIPDFEPPARGRTERGADRGAEPGRREERAERGRPSRGEPDDAGAGRGRGGEQRGGRGEESAGAERPKCFSAEFNQRNECEDCPQETFKACMAAHDDQLKVGKGSEDRGRVGGGREDRTTRRR